MDRHLHLRPLCARRVFPRALAHRRALLTLSLSVRTRPASSLHILHLLSALAIHLRLRLRLRLSSLHRSDAHSQCPVLRVHSHRARLHRKPLNFPHITAFPVAFHETAHCPPHRLGHSPRIGPFDARHIRPRPPFCDLLFLAHNSVRFNFEHRICDASFADRECGSECDEWRGAS